MTGRLRRAGELLAEAVPGLWPDLEPADLGAALPVLALPDGEAPRLFRCRWCRARHALPCGFAACWCWPAKRWVDDREDAAPEADGGPLALLWRWAR